MTEGGGGGGGPLPPQGDAAGVPRMVLEGPEFQKFFDYVEVANFEVASDAFTTFKVQGMPRCKVLGAAACEDNRGLQRVRLRPTGSW